MNRTSLHLGAALVFACSVAWGASLGEALNATNLVWSTGGAASWDSQSTNAHDGQWAARSGVIANVGESWVETEVTGPGVLSFWWRLSAVSTWDSLAFYTNSVLAAQIAGEVWWQGQGVVLGPGTHMLRWVYQQGTSLAVTTSAGWLDQVNYSPPSDAPIIGFQPDTRTNSAGTLATFSVFVNGTEPLTYQWLKNGVPLQDTANVSGSQTAALSLNNVFKADEAAYSVSISNNSGSITSETGELWVIEPVITSHPVSENHRLGQSVSMGTAAVGTPPLRFQWIHDGLPVPGATDAILTLTNLQAGDEGRYRVVVSNEFGTATSPMAVLTVNLATADAGFAPKPNSSVSTVVAQPDGKILLGGNFSNIAGQGRSRIARLNSDGTVDAGFNPGASTAIVAIAVLPDGSLVVGGGFMTLGGQSRKYLGRLDANGVLDTGFNPGPNAPVHTLALQADGKILVGGLFMTMGGQPRKYLARLNPSGSLDVSFNPAPNLTVNAIVVQPDGRIVVGGLFSSIGGLARSRIARLNPDGTIDAGFSSPTVGGGSVDCLALQADGKILIGGGFTSINQQRPDYLARLNADGSLDSEFDTRVLAEVNQIAVQADGRIVIGGTFGLLGNPRLSRSHLARVEADGSPDASFDPYLSGGVASSITLQADGRVLIGGTFTHVGGLPRTNLARLNATEPAIQALSYDGSSITWRRAGTAPEVWTTTFEVSSNGLNWASVGSGQRIPGGWQSTNVNVRSGATIRARGFINTGCINGNSYFVESVVQVRPTILTTDGTFGVVSNLFGFSLRGLPGQETVIEASTDCLEWLPIRTNVMGVEPLFFSDPDWAGFPRRFYRAWAR